MATTKKSTVKKSSPRSTATKSSQPKKVTTKKAKTSAAKAAELKSFRLYRETQPFTQFQITRQTLYWIILVAFIVFAQLWILSLQIEVASLIESQQNELQNI